MIDATQNQARPQAACYPGFDAAFEAVKERIDGALAGSPGLIRSYTAHLAGARGKMIRAAALLACAQGEDGGIPADAAELAAAVEMLHLATLVHDDVIDDADLRRGIPTLQRMYGRRTAVICGDYLLAASLRLAAQVGDRERYLDLRLPDYVGRICLGELGQHLNNGNLELTAYRYLKIIGGKTAALFEAAFYAGALFFTEEERLIRRYARLGRQIGMIFQLTDDCIERGLNMKEGGAVYDFISDLQVGIANLADSLAAVKKVVFEDAAVAPARLWEALEQNFEGPENERIRALLQAAPKYGNDDDYVDNLVVDAYNVYIDEMKKYHNTRYGRGPIGGIYYAGTSSISANVPQGAGTLATPDGRRAGEPLAEGCSPSHAADRNGPTAVFKSVSKLPTEEITGGVLLNQKVTPQMLQKEENREKLVLLLRTFFNRLHGYHVQFNVVSRDTLLDAQAHPENHRDLIVRVAGYSAFFNVLSRRTQDDIIERTEQAL